MRMTNRINKIMNNLNTDTDVILPIPKGVDFIEHMEDSKLDLKNEIDELDYQMIDYENMICLLKEDIENRKEVIGMIDGLIQKKVNR